MPRLYLPTTDINLYPVMIAYSGFLTRIQAVPGALDHLLAGASRRVDSYCHKRIGTPGITTIATGGGIGVAATSVSVSATLGFDNGQEQAVMFNPNGTNQEIIPLLPGGVQVSSWTAPYPGTLQLAQGTAFSHSAGETIMGLYQEVSTVGSSSSSDVYSDSLLQLNQAAQLAAAHAPQFDTSGLVRVILTKQYPIIMVYMLEHALPIDTTYETLDASQILPHPSAGYLRLPIGSFVLPEGLFRSTYTAGYQYIPDDVQRATSFYVADELQMMLSMGARSLQTGKMRGVYRDGQSTKSDFVLAAEEILMNGSYVRLT